MPVNPLYGGKAPWVLVCRLRAACTPLSMLPYTVLQPAARLCLDATSTRALVHALSLPISVPQYKWAYRAAEEAGDLAVMRLLRRLSGVEGDWGAEEGAEPGELEDL